MGTDITLSGGNTVTIANPGTYLVSYSWATDAQSGGEIISASLRLNGTTVPGSQATEVSTTTGGVYAQVNNTMIVTIPTAGSTLQLINSGALSSTVPSTAGSLVADMNIVRIA
jgi:outer membrane lipoprotein-sorting protein